jgi:hypothetical protein
MDSRLRGNDRVAELLGRSWYDAKPIAALFGGGRSADVDGPVKRRAYFTEGLEGKGETKPYGLRGVGAMQGAPSLRGNSYRVYRPF